MTDILALVGALVLIAFVLQLRALLAYPFPRRRHVRLDGPTAAADDPLFAEAQAQAEAIGFGPPIWIEATRVDGELEPWALRAVHRAPDGVGQLWLAAPGNSAHPHRLVTWFAHRLADGRTAISQPFDVYFAMAQGPHLVARSTGQDTLERQWIAHRNWVPTLGSLPVAIADDDVVADADAFGEQVRQDLIAAGHLRALGPDLATPRPGFAWRTRAAIKAMPKPPADASPVPPARIAHFARVIEQMQHRSPPRDVQWSLFAVSVVLFMALGALLWSPETALYVLIVVLVHELGHFLAMRAFGYRNTHILALPLVGGVAMGHDVDPSATRRAWMSLMGPLPGIVVGWTLLALSVTGALEAPWLIPLATVFLLINYLNVLPVPPLDGAHVLEALLPVRWARLQTLLIGALAVVGTLVALWFGLYLLAIIAALQLPALWTGWRLHGIERQLVAHASIGLRPREERIERVARALDEALGATANARERIGQVLKVLHRIDMKPMGLAARLGTSLVYLSLLLVPVAGVLAVGLWSAWGASPSIFAGDPPTARDQQRMRELEAAEAKLHAQAKALSLPELLKALSTEPLPAPATPEAIAAAEARLGQPLPADLRAVYAIADGVPDIALAPVGAIARPNKATMEMLGYGGTTLYLIDGSDEAVEVPLDDVRNWWDIGTDDEAVVFYLPAPHAALPGKRVVAATASRAHAGVRDWLDQSWITAREVEATQVRWKQATARANVKLADAPVATLLASWPEPDVVTRWVNPEMAWGDPVEDADLQAAQARHGRALPAELVEVLRVHDGFPPLLVLPASSIATWGEFTRTLAPETRAQWFGNPLPYEPPYASGEALAGHTEASIAHCLVVAGRGAEPAYAFPALLWCPDDKPARFVDPVFRRGYPSLRAWMLPRAAQMHAVLADVPVE